MTATATKASHQISTLRWLSFLQLFSVGHVLSNRGSVLSLARQKMKDLLLWARVVVRTSKIKTS